MSFHTCCSLSANRTLAARGGSQINLAVISKRMNRPRNEKPRHAVSGLEAYVFQGVYSDAATDHTALTRVLQQPVHRHIMTVFIGQVRSHLWADSTPNITQLERSRNRSTALGLAALLPARVVDDSRAAVALNDQLAEALLLNRAIVMSSVARIDEVENQVFSQAGVH